MDGQLLRFRTANHLSLRDEQELSFIASDRDLEDPRLIRAEGLQEPLLPVCAIYGANASGKTNVLDALWFMGAAVALSHRRWEPDAGVPRTPFALAPSPTGPSTYIIDFVSRGARYEYGFAVDDSAVLEEWLKAWPNGRKQEWYARDGQSFEFHRTLRGENKTIETLTRPNSLFLSTAAQNNHEQLTPIFRWFREALRVVRARPIPLSWLDAHPWWRQFASSEHDARHTLRSRVRALLCYADLGIDDFQVTSEPVLLDNADDPTAPSQRHAQRTRLRLAHRGRGEPTWLDLRSESTGTQTLVALLPELLSALTDGGLFAVDELSALHPMLALALIRLFQDPSHNPKGAQLLFNTHDASLLGNLVADPAPLRRDQIWFTEKDQDGATKLYALTDFTPRKEENLQRGYLQGRYGAVPFIGELTRQPDRSEG